MTDEDFEFERDLMLMTIGDEEFTSKANAIMDEVEAKKISQSWGRTRLKFLILNKKMRTAVAKLKS